MKYLIIIFGLLLFGLDLNGQNQCLDQLNKATIDYRKGNFYGVITKIIPACLSSNELDHDLNKKAFKLKIESYRALDFDIEADDLYMKFSNWIIEKRIPPYPGQTVKQIYDSIPTN